MCRKYYECKNGVVGAISLCETQFKYDIVRQMCWYKEEVNSRCYGPAIGESYYETNDENSQEETMSYGCLDNYTGWAGEYNFQNKDAFDYYGCNSLNRAVIILLLQKKVHRNCTQYYW